MGELLSDLEACGVVRRGEFTLKSGGTSSVYVDFRRVIGKPALFERVCRRLCALVPEKDVALVGVPTAGVPFAAVMAAMLKLPLVTVREKPKAHGLQSALEGDETRDLVLVEDILTTGASAEHWAAILRSHGRRIRKVVAIVDRRLPPSTHISGAIPEANRDQKAAPSGGTNVPKIDDRSVCWINANSYQRGPLNLDDFCDCKANAAGGDRDNAKADAPDRASERASGASGSAPQCATARVPDSHAGGLAMGAVWTLADLLEVTSSRDLRRDLGAWFEGMRGRAVSLESRASLHLVELVKEKSSNLIVSADLTVPEELLDLLDAVGPHVCAVKLHWDLIDFRKSRLTRRGLSSWLKALKKRHRFLLIEDRKFGDIGAISALQIAQLPPCFDMVTVHALAGKAAVEELDKSGLGLVLVCQMSSAGNLLDKSYQAAAAKMLVGLTNAVGAVAQCAQSNVLTLTPGIKLSAEKDGTTGDGAGQIWKPPSPDAGDLFIVGRAIIAHDDPEKAAELHKTACWAAFKRQSPTSSPLPYADSASWVQAAMAPVAPAQLRSRL